MSVKKVVSTEPEWENSRKTIGFNKSCTPHDSVDVSLITAGESSAGKMRYHASFRFGEDFLNLFGEKTLVFSSVADDKRIYFKIDDRGFKCVRYKSFVRVQFTVKNEAIATFMNIWSGKQYKVKRERGYFYIEQEDPLEALFNDTQNGTEQEIDRESIMHSAMQSLKTGKGLPKKNTIEPPVTTVWMTPMPESVIHDKKVLAVLSRMKEKGFVAMSDLRMMNMSDRDYYKAVNDLVTVYGYAIVDIPCVNDTGKRFFVKALYNGTGAWE